METFQLTDFFDPSFQHLILARLLRDDQFLARARSILKPHYFASESLSQLCDAIFEYFDAYDKRPSEETITVAFASKVDGDTLRAEYRDLLTRLYAIQPEDLDPTFIDDEFLWFCQRAEAAECVIAASRNIRDFDIEQLNEKLEKILQIPAQFTNVGTDFKKDWHRLLLPDTRKVFQTGLAGLDQALSGGIREGELMAFMAETGVGKSIICGNVALGLAVMGHIPCIYSLEMVEEQYYRRLAAAFAGVPANSIIDYPDEIREAMEQLSIFSPGTVLTKWMPGFETKIADIEAHMNMVKGKYGQYPIPIVDYVDLLHYREKDEWLGVSKNYVRLRNLGVKYGVPTITVTQSNTFNAEELGLEHQAGSKRKSHHTDALIAVNQSKLDYACNRFLMIPIKNRNERKDLVSYWSINYPQLKITQITAEQYFALTPPPEFFERREQRAVEAERFKHDASEARKKLMADRISGGLKRMG